MMFLAAVAMSVPDLFHLSRGDAALPVLHSMSVGISVVLLIIYALSLLFALKNHRHLSAASEDKKVKTWSQRSAVITLLSATAGVVVGAELIVESLEPTPSSASRSSQSGATRSTRPPSSWPSGTSWTWPSTSPSKAPSRSRFVAPVSVLISIPLGHPLSLEFNHLEVVGLGVAVGAATSSSSTANRTGSEA